ncbi:MAG: hypothetical protein ABS939_02515 [Psychrobacillus sp.]
MNKTIIALDPSGNHASEGEGSGTTGIAIYRNGMIELRDIKASDYESTEHYWYNILNIIIYNNPDYVVFEGYKLYNHKGMSAQTQANSTLMTSQLIGAIRMVCFNKQIKTHTQFATDVKSRWADHILQYKGYLDKQNRFNDQQTNPHKRDSLRHLLHFMKYNLPKLEGN